MEESRVEEDEDKARGEGAAELSHTRPSNPPTLPVPRHTAYMCIYPDLD